MKNELLQDNLKIETATEKDWLEILQLLEENDLTFWFTGNDPDISGFSVNDGF